MRDATQEWAKSGKVPQCWNMAMTFRLGIVSSAFPARTRSGWPAASTGMLSQLAISSFVWQQGTWLAWIVMLPYGACMIVVRSHGSVYSLDAIPQVDCSAIQPALSSDMLRMLGGYHTHVLHLQSQQPWL